jgi:hypothetical protein
MSLLRGDFLLRDRFASFSSTLFQQLENDQDTAAYPTDRDDIRKQLLEFIFADLDGFWT